MPIFGGRIFANYAVTWIPYLALLAVTGAGWMPGKLSPTRRVLWALCIAQPLIALALSAHMIARGEYRNYSGDGSRVVSDFLAKHLQPADNLYVWGPHYEVYVYTGRRSAYSLVNTIMIHPDWQIQDPAARTAHIVPEYESRFLAELGAAPPTWLVISSRGVVGTLPSPADSAVRKLAFERYARIFSYDGVDFLKKPSHFEVFRLKQE